MPRQIITRKDAHASKITRYYTGRLCAHGHDAERFVSTGACVQCNALRQQAFRSTRNYAENNRLAGNFVYSMHPDDFPKALAFCQGLDLSRGRLPKDLNTIPAHGHREPGPNLDQIEANVRASRDALHEIEDGLGYIPKN